MLFTRHDGDLDSDLGLIQGNHATSTGIHLGDSSWGLIVGNGTGIHHGTHHGHVVIKHTTRFTMSVTICLDQTKMVC